MNWEQVIQQLLQDGRFLATEAFRISVQQVYNVARADIIGGIILLILGVIGLFIMRWGYRMWEAQDFKTLDLDDYWQFWAGLVSVVVGFLLGIDHLFTAMLYLGNPQWYAAKWMLENLLSK